MNLPKKKGLLFGDLIAAVYDACGKRKAGGIVRLAVNAHLVTFRGPNRYLITLTESQRPSLRRGHPPCALTKPRSCSGTGPKEAILLARAPLTQRHEPGQPFRVTRSLPSGTGTGSP